MPLPLNHHHSRPVSDPPAIVKTVTRADVLWNRPIFKAPPLDVQPIPMDATALAEDLRRIGMVQR